MAVGCFSGYHMGITENVAKNFKFETEQDKFSLNSQNKALKAIEEKKFKMKSLIYQK